MASSNDLVKPHSNPEFLKTDKGILKGHGDSLPEPSLSRKQKKDIEKFGKQMKDNTKY